MSAESFDLHAARKARSTTPVEQRKHCPECGSVRIHRVGNKRASQRPDVWYCEECRTEVDEPSIGPPEGSA